MKNQTLQISLLFGVPWTLTMLVVKSFSDNGLTQTTVISTILSGIIASLAFGFLLTRLGSRLYKKITIALYDNESLIKEGGANHFKKNEGVGGKLALTNKRLIFKSHNLNLQNHESEFNLDQIAHIEMGKTFNVMRNVLRVQIDNSEKHKFIVDEADLWMAAIIEQKNATGLRNV
jgi:hypothetical protein